MTDTATPVAPAEAAPIMGWSGIVLPLDVWAGELDRRIYRDASWPELPLTLADNHWGTEFLGPIDRMEIRNMAGGGRGVWAAGRFAPTDEATEVAGQLAFWGRLPVSVEIRDGAFVERVVEDPDVEVAPDVKDFQPIETEMDWSMAVIGAMAIERLPAFADAFIVPDAEAAGFVPAPMMATAQAATLPIAVESLRAAARQEVRSAGAGAAVMPSRMFTRFDYAEPSRLSIAPDGEITGHVAVWGRQYRSTVLGNWTAAPCGDLSEWLVGATALDDGTTAATGVICADGLHAPAHGRGDGFDEVRRLIEDTATQLAVVRAWEDEHGLAVHGSTLPGVTQEQATRAMAGCASIDQRRLDARGFLTMGVHIVNTCGFKPGQSFVQMEGGEPVTRLVAAAGVPGCGCGSDVCSCHVETPGEAFGRGVAEGMTQTADLTVMMPSDEHLAEIIRTAAAEDPQPAGVIDLAEHQRLSDEAARLRLKAATRTAGTKAQDPPEE